MGSKTKYSVMRQLLIDNARGIVNNNPIKDKNAMKNLFDKNLEISQVIYECGKDFFSSKVDLEGLVSEPEKFTSDMKEKYRDATKTILLVGLLKKYGVKPEDLEINTLLMRILTTIKTYVSSGEIANLGVLSNLTDEQISEIETVLDSEIYESILPDSQKKLIAESHQEFMNTRINPYVQSGFKLDADEIVSLVKMR